MVYGCSVSDLGTKQMSGALTESYMKSNEAKTAGCVKLTCSDKVKT